MLSSEEYWVEIKSKLVTKKGRLRWCKPKSCMGPKVVALPGPWAIKIYQAWTVLGPPKFKPGRAPSPVSVISAHRMLNLFCLRCRVKIPILKTTSANLIAKIQIKFELHLNLLYRWTNCMQFPLIDVCSAWVVSERHLLCFTSQLLQPLMGISRGERERDQPGLS